MALWDLINAARERYLEAYRQTLRAQRPRLDQLTPEVLAAANGADHVPDAYRLFRVDLVWQEQGQPRVGALDGGPMTVRVPSVTDYPDDRRVTVTALRWDDCVFRASPGLDDGAPLRSWLGQWMDRADQNPVDPDGLHGAVHSMTPPQRQPDGSTLHVVDFGSAPPEAFTSLIATFFGAGTTHITIGDDTENPT